jgi:glycine/D-amino acid oxidase-like deaminating enzyme
MPSFDVVILGGGIVGCACAFECTQAGMSVALVESGEPAGGATAAGMGHIVVMDDSPAQLALTRYSSLLWQEIRPRLPARVEYESRGTIWVAADDEEMAEVAAKHALFASAGISSSILASSELATEEPHLRSGLAGGLLVPNDAVLYPPSAAMFFLEEAAKAGAVLLRGASAVTGGQGIVKLSDGNSLQAKLIVVATGTNTTVVPGLPVHKRKGHLLITDRYPGLLSHQLVELGYLKSAHKISADSVAFNVQPRSTGQLLIGSSRQYGSDDPAAEAGILRRMLDRACEYMPVLGQLSAIRVWTGFRAATPDKLPFIGPTEDATVFLAMGFEGLGITNALGAARLLVDFMLGRQPAIDPAPYLPSRFPSSLSRTDSYHAEPANA